MIRILGCREDVASFIMGLSGPELRGLNERERHRVREYFTGFFGSRCASTGAGCTDRKKDRRSPVQGCDAARNILPGIDSQNR
ncbi:MAG: hypothetical protein ABSB80_02755 [Methanoregula sp.]|uniref:hypothetical protein n=1 Tax=Methanoregula sp. TaxID=2052170 RepID=UPI003D131A26